MATTLGNGTITFGDGTTLSTASMIQSIQRGTVYKNYTNDPPPIIPGNTGVVNISAVVTSKCMIILTGTSAMFVGYDRIGSNPFVTSFNSTTQFTWVSPLMSIYSESYFSWQVIEFK